MPVFEGALTAAGLRIAIVASGFATNTHPAGSSPMPAPMATSAAASATHGMALMSPP